MMDNDGFIDVQIILADDFHVQQTISLTDLIYEKYWHQFLIRKCYIFKHWF